MLRCLELAIPSFLTFALACSGRPGPASAKNATSASQTVSSADARAKGADAPTELMGWAAGTRAGRGGAILRVTTLANAGPGSFTEALQSDGPRIVVFEVSGVIDLDLQTIDVKAPFLTIAGQTAPSPGITLIRGGIRIKTHDVLVQHLRVRPGEASQPKQSGWEVDAISTSTGAHDVMVDHCSMTWATDENLSASGDRFRGETPDEWRAATSHRITFSNNIVAEGLSHSTHRKGEHSKGSLIHDNVTDVAIIGNLFASNVERNPFFKGGARGIVVNNYIVNPRKYAMKYTLVADEWGTHPAETGQMAVVGNVFQYGPDTEPDVPLVYSSGIGPVEIFVADNIARNRASADVPLLGGTMQNFLRVDRAPLWPQGMSARPASEVRERIRRDVGARPWDRDATDTRIVEQALAGGGKIVDGEQELGGYEASSSTHQRFDENAWNLETMTPRNAGSAR